MCGQYVLDNRPSISSSFHWRLKGPLADAAGIMACRFFGGLWILEFRFKGTHCYVTLFVKLNSHYIDSAVKQPIQILLYYSIRQPKASWMNKDFPCPSTCVLTLSASQESALSRSPLRVRGCSNQSLQHHSFLVASGDATSQLAAKYLQNPKMSR